MKVSELIGPALDWAVAKCEDLPIKYDPMGFRYDHPNSKEVGYWIWDETHILLIGRDYAPSTDWSHAGPIIERENITIRFWDNVNQPTAYMQGGDWYHGNSALIAAMRCYVASRFGDNIDIPKGLV